jgi:hypothetical protein
MEGRRMEHDDRHRDGQRDQRPERRDGPDGTGFLDLEISRLIHEEGRRLARDAARQLLAEAILARLRERLGDRLSAVGAMIADELADDVETNLGIEERIEARKESRRDLDGRVRAIMSAKPAKATKRR